MTTDTLCTAAPDELERLRAENARLIHDIQAPDGYTWEWHCTRKDEELAKLRQALGLLTTLKPDMEIDVLDPLDMAQQIVEYVSQSNELTTAYLAGFHKRDDEIERLRLDLLNTESRLAWHDRTLAERDAEIERLRTEHQEYVATAMALQNAVAEIERLQRTVNDLKSGWQSTYDHDTNWLKSEIERLRREHEKAWADAQLKAAEIERLRKLKEHPYPRERTWSDCEAELQQLRDELAREKQEHDITRTFHDIAVKERNYERVLALKRDEEIERLRGFARRVLRAWPEGDIDGGELQDAAIEAGLLVKVEPPPSEPCGERCSCADYYAPEDFASGDVVCYRRVREALGDA